MCNRFPIKNLVIDSLLTPIVESTYLIYELALRNFDCSLEFVFSLLLLQPFNFSPVSFACNFQDWGCVILREIDFLLKICWSIPCLHPSWKVHTWNTLMGLLLLAITNLWKVYLRFKYLKVNQNEMLFQRSILKIEQYYNKVCFHTSEENKLSMYISSEC